MPAPSFRRSAALKPVDGKDVGAGRTRPTSNIPLGYVMGSPLRYTFRSVVAAGVLLITSVHGLRAQQRKRRDDSCRCLNLAVNGKGLQIGDSRGVTGLRLNYRDS